MVNQASSDSELMRRQNRLMTGSLGSLDPDSSSKKDGSAGLDGVGGSSSSNRLKLLSVQNMKTNVTEKVAQVSV
jgi:hypothetical protein